MKKLVTSVGVFMLIICVDSVIELKSTIPYDDSFPALILKRHLTSITKLKPGVPNDIKKKKGTDTEMFKFEMFNRMFDFARKISLSYECPESGNILKLKKNENPRCKNELKVAVFKNGRKCGNEKRKEYDIGYGIIDTADDGINKYFPSKNPQEKKRVLFPLYTSCFDEEEKRVYFVKYEFRGKNNLYHRSNTIYPEEQREKIEELDKSFVANMAKKLNFSQEGDENTEVGDKNIILERFSSSNSKSFSERSDDESNTKTSELIPFQLVSHEDMILYNLKLTTFNEMNYSFIWSNIAENAWKNINTDLRNFMIQCNLDLEVYSGVHDYSEDGFPRYLWKYVRHDTSGAAVVIHNHPIDDKQNYPHLCEDENVANCGLYGLFVNQNDKNTGYTYCCPASYLKDKIPFFEDKFSDSNLIDIPYLRNIDDENHSQSAELVYMPEKPNSSSEPSSLTSNMYTRKAAPEPQKPIPSIDNDVKNMQIKLQTFGWERRPPAHSRRKS